jgi:hypothetical protein
MTFDEKRAAAAFAKGLAAMIEVSREIGEEPPAAAVEWVAHFDRWSRAEVDRGARAEQAFDDVFRPMAERAQAEMRAEAEEATRRVNAEAEEQADWMRRYRRQMEGVGR